MLLPRTSYLINQLTGAFIPDSVFPWIRYAVTHRRLPNLNPPLRLSEKVLFCQMFDYSPKRRIFADKLAVRDFAAQHGYADHLPKLHGSYERFSDINFDELPDRFVVKGNHGCDFNFFVKDKSKLDKRALEEACNSWLSVDFYFYRREWYYRNLPRRIIIEEFIQGPEGKAPWDYKIFVSNGVPQLIVVDIDRFVGHKRVVYDANWERLPIKYEKGPFPPPVERPKKLDEMLAAAAKFAEGLQLARADFYIVNDDFIIGEISNMAGGGNITIQPDEWDLRLGDQFGPCVKVPPVRGS